MSTTAKPSAGHGHSPASPPPAGPLEVLLREYRSRAAEIRQGGGPKGIARQHKLDRLTARERIDLLCDRLGDQTPPPANTPNFLELGLWAAEDMYPDVGGVPAAGVVVGLGRVSGRMCVIVANDATVKAGAFFPQTCKKVLRAQRFASDNLLPILYLVDSAGVFLPMQDEIFPDEDDFGRIFRNNAVLSARGVPQFSAIMGNCVAGGGYLPVMCDSLIMTEGSGLYLAGPALVKAAIGQEVSSEDLGGARMHAAISGTIDYREPNDALAIERLRRLVGKLGHRPHTPFQRSQPQPPARPPERIFDPVAAALPKGHASAPTASNQRHAGAPPASNQGSVGVPPASNQGSAGVPPASNQGSAGVPPASDQGHAGVPPAKGGTGPENRRPKTENADKGGPGVPPRPAPDFAKAMYDVRDLLAHLLDRDSFDEFKPEYGQSLVCGFGRLDGWSIGVVANQKKTVKPADGPLQYPSVIYVDSADKAARFILQCNQMKCPLLFVQDVNGFMVGRDSEQEGIIRSGAKLVNAVSNSIVPKLTLITGGSFGAGNYAMCGKAYDPRFLFAWPTAKYAVMGAAAAAKTLLQLELARLKKAGHEPDPAELRDLEQRITTTYEQATDIRYAAARGWVDAIIEPAQTREVLAWALEAVAYVGDLPELRTGVFQV